MNMAVVPVQNEQGRICQVLSTLSHIDIQQAVVVLNGCSDNSLEEIKECRLLPIRVVYFTESLGVDVPRAVGASVALQLGADAVLFVDGDMTGAFTLPLEQLLHTVKTGALDLALTDCYPSTNFPVPSPLAQEVLYYRLDLNTRLGLFSRIGTATPSHGPHATSRRLLETVGPRDLAIPPVFLAKARKLGFSIGIGTIIPHYQLGSPARNSDHSILVAETIIGDCLMARAEWEGKKPTRIDGKTAFPGYHPWRRLDLYDQYAKRGFPSLLL